MAGYSTLSVIGGGAWGTALANLAACNAVKTSLWAREADVVDAINTAHINRPYLPDIALSTALKATQSLEKAVQSEAVLFVVPVQYARATLMSLQEIAPQGKPLLLCSKGVEAGSNRLLTEVAETVWPPASLAVLSGPSFARDVALGMPTAVTLAAADEETGARWVETLRAPHFRPYASSDLIGAELGGAVKNVLAIAAGAVIGRGLGDSARAAVIARGFAEFQRLGAALGAEAETMAGLSGLGDLILTATSTQSRNTSLGVALGEGRALDAILSERRSVSEGVATAAGVVALGARAGVELPICEAVAALVSGEASLDALIEKLLSRPLTREFRT
ncbi:MAG: NAD(P)H-dependent glycerol-3-phosphate dehydrogenase [Pseudomonadota bacterium]